MNAMATFQVEPSNMANSTAGASASDRAELLIAQQGAQILSYQRIGEPPLLWLSDQAIFRQGKSVRAGYRCAGRGSATCSATRSVQAMYHGEQAPPTAWRVA
jgi:glucose-6-phosphate 1-epimerase